MIRIVAKLCVVVAAVATFLRTTPSYAETPSFASNTGGGVSCTLTQPCALDTAIAKANLASGTGRVICLNAIDETQTTGDSLNVGNQTTEVFCPQGALGNIVSFGTNQTLRMNGLTLLGTTNGIGTLRFLGSGTLILENCAFVDGTAAALDIEPNGPLILVIKNSRISNNAAAGVLIKPAAGSVTATFDGVTITNNAGGLRTDSTNGAVRVDITNSTISNNANNGLIAIGGAGGQNMMSVRNDVIASNSQAGIEASGGNAAVLVNNTLLDSNTLGALQAVSGGRILTYQNNNIIGSPGTGFTGTASPN